MDGYRTAEVHGRSLYEMYERLVCHALAGFNGW